MYFEHLYGAMASKLFAVLVMISVIGLTLPHETESDSSKSVKIPQICSPNKWYGDRCYVCFCNWNGIKAECIFLCNLERNKAGLISRSINLGLLTLLLFHLCIR